MAYQIAAIRMTFSDLQDHSPTPSRDKRDFCVQLNSNRQDFNCHSVLHRPSTIAETLIKSWAQLYLWNYKNKNWLQFLFIVKAAVLKQQISKFYPQIQRTEASDHIYFSQRRFINVKAIFCA